MSQMHSKEVARRYREAYGDDAPTSDLASEPIKTKLVAADWWIIIVLTLIAGGMRLYSLGYAPLWFDELWTWRVSNQTNPSGLFHMLTEDIHLPGYFVITMAFLRAFGDGEFVMRLPAAIFGILSIPAAFVLGRRVFGRVVGAMVAIILTFSGAAFYYSQEARPYSMMLFLGIVTSYLWYQLYERVFVDEAPAGRLGVGLWLMLVVSCFTHYFSVLLTVFQLAIFGYIAFKQTRGRKILVAYCLGLGVLAALWAPVLGQQLQNLFSWTTVVPFLKATRDFVSFTFGTVSLSYNFQIIGAGFLCLICLLFLFRNGVGVFRAESKREFYLSLILAILWFCPFLFAEIVSIAVKPIFVSRYLLFCIPFAALALSIQVRRLAIPNLWHIAAAVLVVGIPGYYFEVGHFFTRPQRDQQGDWKKVITEIHEQTPSSGKTVVLALTERLGVAQYYFSRVAPDLKIAGEANTPQMVQGSVDNVLKQHPDHVVLFFGQMGQKQQRATVLVAAQLLSKSFGPADVIDAGPDSLVGALLFSAKH